MTDRKSMDGPALGVALLMGTLLIAAGATGIVLLGGGTTYDIGWIAESAAASEVVVNQQQAEAQEVLALEGALPAHATVSVRACNDAATPVDAAATVTWRLVEVSTSGGATVTRQLDEKTFTCANAPDEGWTIHLADAPAVPEVEAGSLDAATDAVEDEVGPLRTNATYTLEVSWSRPATVPVPGLPQPAFSTTLDIEVHAWSYTVSEHEEVVR